MYLLNPGIDHNETTIGQDYCWHNLRETIHTLIKFCINVQKNKKQRLKCVRLPPKEAESIIWYRSLVDILGPYIIIREVHVVPLILKAFTMVDPETSWFEIIKYIGKQADIISNLVDKTWFLIYLRPTIIAYDRGNELLIHEF